jgi:hypothetical protein
MPLTGVPALVVVSFYGREYHALRLNQLDLHVLVFQHTCKGRQFETRKVSGYTSDEKRKDDFEF